MAPGFDRLKAALADRYQIEREIGQGGMATVYLAKDLKHERQVAIKVLKPELAAVIGAERFLAEIKTTANLQHPHILPLFDSGQADSFLFYVMPYVDGESLRDRLDREKQLPIDETVEITRAVASALDYAHRHAVIHRDIKPANILLHEGQPQVADFGIALAVSAAGGNRLTETGLSLGTPHYMSPEQATAERELDGRSDLYSLGCVTYEMLAGEPPFTAPTSQAVVARILTDDPADLTSRRRSVPLGLAAAVNQALEKLPADRFATAGEFAAALADPAFGRAGPGASVRTRAGSWNRLSVALATVAVAVIGVSAVLILGRQSTERPLTIREVLPRPTPAPAFGSSAILSPDGRRIVYPRPDEFALVKRVDQAVPDTLPFVLSQYRPAFSPDGESLVHYSGANVGRLTISALSGAEGRLLTTDARYMGLDWTADGWVYFIDSESGVSRIRSSGEDREVVLAAPVRRDGGAATQPYYGWMDVLPNGKGMLLTVGAALDASAQDHISFYDFSSGTLTPLTQGVFSLYAESGHLLVVRADGSLWAIPFTQDAPGLTGDPVRIFEGIQIRRNGVVDLSVSQSGSLLHGRGDVTGSHEVVYVSRTGIVEGGVDPSLLGEIRYVALSPDGEKVAVTLARFPQPHNIWVKDLGTGSFRKLTSGNYDVFPVFTPDSESVTYVGPRGGVNWDAYWADLNGTPRLVLDLPVYIRGAFIPRGDPRLVFYSEANDAAMAADIDGGEQAIDTLFTEPQLRSLTISPDGRLLAYTSTLQGTQQVRVRPFPRAQSNEWTVTTNGATEPEWGPNGEELFFVTEAGNLASVSVRQEGSSLSFGPEVPLFSYDGYVSYAVLPGGQRLVMARERDPVEWGSLVLVHNWFEELNELFDN